MSRRIAPRQLLLSAALGMALSLPLGTSAWSQERASLVADSLRIEGDSQLIAEGSVEVFFQGRRLSASKIVFDQSKGQLTIAGPIRLTDASGETTILASQAELSSDLTEGLLISANVVLKDQLQIAAAEARRVGGRYLQLDRAVASSCKVCSGSETPLWEIRARKITHDQTKRQIYFTDAQLRFGGVPVFYIPRLRMPDPTLNRSSGFLLPKISSSTNLGTGIELPYFLTLGPSRDVTLSPFVTTDNARSVNLRYRQAFANGNVTVLGAVAKDRILSDTLRGYLLADGSFALQDGYNLTFHGETVSDDAYLSDYDISDDDRLTSHIDLTRVQRDALVYGTLRKIDTLRSDEKASSIPSVVADAIWLRRFELAGGQGNLSFSSHGHLRSSSSLLDLDANGIPDGRDVTRASVGAEWRRDWVLPGGVLGAILTQGRADFYDITQDPLYQGQAARLWGAAGVELRWPLVKAGPNGVRQVLEPIVQIVASPDQDPARIPNEDSALVEFDEASLFSLNRFPGSDAVETGLRANVGVNWSRIDPNGYSLGATLGRVFRTEAATGFSDASGFDGSTSDWLAELRVNSANGLAAAGRVITDDNLSVARAELQFDYSFQKVSLQSGYIWSLADPAESRPDDIAELVMAGGYDLTPNWRASASGRYDFAADRASRAQFGLSFQNECVLLDLSLSRRFTSSTTVQPGTRFGLTLELIGFGSGTEAGPARVCRR